MTNIVSLHKARMFREGDRSSRTLADVEEAMYLTLRTSTRHNKDPLAITEEFFKILKKGIIDGEYASETAEDLTTTKAHLLRSWAEMLPQTVRYLKSARFYSQTGGHDVIVDDGLEREGDDPFPESMIMVSMGRDPFGDESVFSSVSLCGTTIWFDDEFQEFDKPAVKHNPAVEPAEGCRHIDRVPKVNWVEGINTTTRGMVSPILVEALLHDFICGGAACNMGVKYQMLNGLHRFTYMECISNSSLVSWSLTLHSEIYTIDFLEG